MAAASDIRAGRAFVELTTRDGALIKGLNRAQRKIQDFADSARRVGLVLTGIGVAAATAFVPAIRAASDAEEGLNRFNAVFGRQAGNAGRFVDELAQTVKRSRFEIRDSIASFQAFFVGLGFGGEQAADLSKQVQQAAIDFASFNNIADAEAANRFRAALSGSSEVLDQFGVNIKVAAIDQELLRQGFTGGAQAATEQQKALARLAIITRAMTEQGAMGDAARTADSFANRLKGLQAALKDLQVEIGSQLLPVVTPLVERSTALLKLAGDFVAANSQLLTGLFKLAGGFTAVGVAMLSASAAAQGASLAFSLVTRNIPTLAILGAFASVSLAIAGVTAELNQGRIAGQEYSLTLAKSLGIVSGQVDALAAANERLAKAGRDVNEALDRQRNATTIREEVEATRDAVKALEEKVAAKEEEIRANVKAVQPIVVQGGGQLLGPGPTVVRSDQEAAEQTERLREAALAADPVLAGLNRQLAEQRRLLANLVPQSVATDFQQLGESAKRGLRTFSAVIRQIGDELVRRQAAFQRNIRDFAAVGLEAEVARIERQRDALLQQAGEAGVLTPGVRRQIEDIAASQIDEVRQAPNEALQQEIARLEIQTGTEGIDQQRRLLELERQIALERADVLGQSTDLINKQFDLRAQLLEQQFDQGVDRFSRGSFNARALQSLQTAAATPEERRTADSTTRSADYLREILDLFNNGSLNVG